MSTITAALGLSQIRKLVKLIIMRQDNAGYLSSKISKIPEIQTPNILKDNEHIFQMYTIKLPNSQIRTKLQSYLTEKGIFSKVYTIKWWLPGRILISTRSINISSVMRGGT